MKFILLSLERVADKLMLRLEIILGCTKMQTCACIIIDLMCPLFNSSTHTTYIGISTWGVHIQIPLYIYYRWDTVCKILYGIFLLTAV